MNESIRGASSVLCHVCGGASLTLLSDFPTLRRVTSDCKPWPAGGTLGACSACGVVQKVTDARWQKECDAIYTGYTIYHNAGGLEQQVFGAGDGQASSRSARLIQQIGDRIGWKPTGRLLDVGCGNGALLRSFSQLVPGWSLVGSELNDKYRSVIESISGVEKLYTCDLDQIPGDFDAITLLHCLEHVPHPVAFLNTLRSKLRPGGRIIVDVPDHIQNPFDLLIADHCSHFSKTSLVRVFAGAGMGVVAAADDWIAKELTVIGQLDEPALEPSDILMDSDQVLRAVRDRVDWLLSLPQAARALRDRGPLGIFGTSIAATWLGSELGDDVSFYVDEDVSRQGTPLEGKPVFSPGAIPPGGQVFLGLSPVVARAIHRRMRGTEQRWHLPPEMSRAA